MAMKKVEMEAHQAEYDAFMREARAAEQAGLYSRAVELALASWEHVDGMMQYGRKYEEKDFSTVRGIDVVLRYAPLLLDFPSLDKLESLLKDCRRIEKNTSDSLAERLAEARTLLWDTYHLWDHIERNPGARQDKLREVLGGDQDQWRGIAETWEKMALVTREPEGGSYRLALATRMGSVVGGKCPSCGDVVRAPKGMLLEEQTCPECGKSVRFVILSTKSGTHVKE